MNVLVTGSSGLIGSEAVSHFDRDGHRVTGIDNNLRREFFGPAGDTLWNLAQLRKSTKQFTHLDLDIRTGPASSICSRRRSSTSSSIAPRSRRTTRRRRFRSWIST